MLLDGRTGFAGSWVGSVEAGGLLASGVDTGVEEVTFELEVELVVFV